MGNLLEACAALPKIKVNVKSNCCNTQITEVDGSLHDDTEKQERPNT
jgi:hypothetical protein